MKRICLSVCVLLCALILTACGRKRTTTGWYLETVEGSEEAGPLIVRDDITSLGEYTVSYTHLTLPTILLV